LVKEQTSSRRSKWGRWVISSASTTLLFCPPDRLRICCNARCPVIPQHPEAQETRSRRQEGTEGHGEASKIPILLTLDARDRTWRTSHGDRGLPWRTRKFAFSQLSEVCSDLREVFQSPLNPRWHIPRLSS